MKFLKLVDKFVATLLIMLMLAVVLAISWQVFARYIIGQPSTVSSELARFALMWIGMLGAAYCYRLNCHLSLNVITQKLTIKAQKYTEAFSHLVIVIFAVVVLVIGGLKLVMLTLNPVQLSPVLEMKIAYVYAVLPLSGVLIFIYASDKLWRLIKEIATSEYSQKPTNIGKTSADLTPTKTANEVS